MKKRTLFSIHCLGYVFTPTLIPTLIFIPLFWGLCQLGLWQFHRAEYKHELEKNYAEHTRAPALSWNQIHSPLKQHFNRVRISGIYENQRSFLIDNAVLNHRVGYWVITPFKISRQSKWLLINRGWIARKANRLDLPQLPMISGQQTIEGLIQLPPTKSFVLSGERESSTWPQVLEKLDLKEISSLLSYPVQNFLLLLSPQSPGGFEREWVAQAGLPPERHQAYAIQWFALALSLAIIYLALNVHRDKRHP